MHIISKHWVDNMFTKVLIPTDGTGLEDHAINYSAIAFPDAEFHTLSVIQPHVKGTHLTRLMIQMQEESANKAVDHAEGLLKKLGIKKIKKKILRGDPSKNILKYADTQDIDIIVMRSYCAEGVQNYKLGSTIEKVLGHIHCPMLLISHTARRAKPKKILLSAGRGVDPKKLENVALFIAKSYGAKLTTLFVLERKGSEREREFGEKVLTNLAWKAEHVGIEVEKVFEHGDPAEKILEAAMDHDLIIMGAGKKKILRRIAIGHVAREVCATSPAPILLVRGHHLR
jgi:nucleotide-binding universal stress UspA family protein